MNTISKPNDWFLARVENPDFHYDDFAAQDITIENTALRSKDVYQNSDYVKELFTDEQGNFKQQEFDRAYTEIAKSYQVYANKQYEEGALEDMEFDPYDPFRPIDSKVYTPEAKLVREVNPLGKAAGFTGIGSVGPAVRSASESAQMSKIFDWETQKFRDYSPNDVALENSIVGFVKQALEPLVMAQYESDGWHEDPFSGERVAHKKGEYKINDQGMYYYETLGGRSAYGKQFKSIADSFTVDGSSLNDYDFFDSDGLDKSVVGTLMKTAVTIAPLFTPIAPYYGWAMIGTELLDLLPTVYEATVGNFSEDTNPTLNYIQGLGKSLKGSTTEYAKEHMLALENLGTIISDVALQWQQFRIIPQAYNKIVGTDKAQKAIFAEAEQMAKKSVQKRTMETALKQGVTDEKALAGIAEKVYQQELSNALGVLNKTKLEPLLKANNRTGANVALGYMSALQSVQTYEDAINLGTSKTEAAAIAWGTALGVYAVGRTGLGELFFPELQDVNKKAYTVAINKMRDSIQSGINNLASMPKKSKLLKLMDVGKKASSKFWQDVKDHSLGFVGKSIGEGIEEMAEEGISDFFKATHNLAAEFGVASTDKQFSFEDMGERYLMSFVGGSMGGAVFAGVDLVNHIKSPESVKQELTYLLRNGRKEELLQELDTLHKKGKLGSKILSTDYTEDPTDPQVRYFQTAESEDKSHNTFIYNKMKNYIEAIDTAINQEKINYSDEDVLDKLARADERLTQVQEVIGKDGINGRYLQRFNTLTSDIITQKAKIAQLENETPDEKKQGEEKDNFQKTLAQEYSKLEDLKKELNDYFSDANVVDYANKLLFEINSNVNSAFYNANAQQYIEGLSGKNISDLSEQQINKYKEDYEVFKKMSIREKFDDAYTIFKNLNHTMVNDINSKNDAYTKYGEMRRYILEEVIDPIKTAEKFGEHESIDSIVKYAVHGTVDLSEVVKDEYLPKKELPIPEGATDEQIAKIEEYNELQKTYRANIYNKLKDTVAQLKSIGFIDTDTKKLLLSLSPRLNMHQLLAQDILQRYYFNELDENLELKSTKVTHYNTSVIKEIIKILDQRQLKVGPKNMLVVDVDEQTGEPKGYAFNQDTKEQALREVIEILNDFSKFKDFKPDYTYLTKQISQVLVKYLNDPGETSIFGIETNPNRIRLSGAVNDDRIMQGVPDWEYNVTGTWFGNRVYVIMQYLQQAIENSDEYKMYNDLQEELNTVQDNPVYDFLQKLSVSINGAHSSVIDIIQKKGQELESGDIENFQIDSVVVDEIDSALNLIDIATSLVNAADTQEFSSFKVHGHNAVINDFSKRMGLPTEYGTISQENAFIVRQNLESIAQKLNLIRQISLLNEANSFKEQDRTGKITTKVLTQALKCVGKYTALKDVSIYGIGLFDGVEGIATESTDKNTKDLSDDVYIEHANVAMTIYNNYQKILKQAYANGLTESDAAKEVIEQLRKVFSSKELQEQETSELNSALKTMTDSDIMTYIITTCSIDPITWNTALKRLIGSETTKFVPLYPQELTAMIGTALANEGSLFQQYIKSIAENFEEDGAVPNALYNWLICTGVGGAGKTSVVGKIIYEVVKTLNPEAKTWNVGPTSTQIENLNKTLPSDSSMEVDGLMQKILNGEEYEELKNVLNEKKVNSRYCQESSKNIQVKLPNDLKFSDVSAPSVVFIDECTYVNSIYAAIIAEWARQKGVTIIGLGDSKQSGFYDDGMHLFNVSRGVSIATRTPELNISMRASNIQKKANNNKLSSILTLVNSVSYGQSEKKPLLEKLIADFKLRYYIGEDHQVQGEYITDTVTKESIQQIVKGCKSFIYVYDDINSPTYSIVQQLKTENPEVKIDLFTLNEVQGREADQVLVDINFKGYKQDNYANMRAVNTALTRSLVGTTIINNGFTDLFPELKNIQDSYTAPTPDPSKIVESYKKTKLKIIDRILNEVTAPIKAEPPAPDDETSEETPESEETTPSKPKSKRTKLEEAAKLTPEPSPEEETTPPTPAEEETPSETAGKTESPESEKSKSENDSIGDNIDSVRSFVKGVLHIDAEEERFGSDGKIPKPMVELVVSAFQKEIDEEELVTAGLGPQDLQSFIDRLQDGSLDKWDDLITEFFVTMSDNLEKPMIDRARELLVAEIKNDKNLPESEQEYSHIKPKLLEAICNELENKNIQTLKQFYDIIESDEVISTEDQKKMEQQAEILKDYLTANESSLPDNEKTLLKKIIQKYNNEEYVSYASMESDVEKLERLRTPELPSTILTDQDLEFIGEVSDSLDEGGNQPPSIEPQYNFAKGIRTLGNYTETGIDIKSDIVTYYENPNIKSDYQIWLKNQTDLTTEQGQKQFDNAKKLHSIFKRMLLHYPDQPEIALECVQKEMGRSYKEGFQRLFKEGKYKIIAKYNSANTIQKNAVVVYSYYNTDGKENIITLSQLSNPDTWLNYLTNVLGTENVDPDEVKAANTYKTQYENLLKKVDKVNPVHVLELDKEGVISAQFNIISPEERYSITKVDEMNTDIIHSRPFIYSGRGDSLTKCNDPKKQAFLKEKAKKLQGKAVMFMTTCPYVQDYDGEFGGGFIKVTQNNIEQLYMQQRKHGHHHIIRRMIVDPAAQYATNRWEKGPDKTPKITGYLNIDLTEFSEDGSVDKSDAILHGSEIVGVRMFVGLWNYRAALLSFKNFIKDHTEDNGMVIASKINEKIAVSESNILKQFRLSTVDSEYRVDPNSPENKYISHFDCSPITNKNNNSPFQAGLHMTQKELNIQLTYIDGIIEFIYQNILKNGETSLTQSSSSQLLNPLTRIDYNSRVYKKLFEASSGTIKIQGTDVKLNEKSIAEDESMSGIETTLANINKNKSKSIVIFLSRLYKIIALQGQRSETVHFDLGNIKIGNKEFQLPYEDTLAPLLSSGHNPDLSYKGKYRASVFLDIINTALHGRPRPYTQKIHALPSPFPRGIFYNLIYKGHSKDQTLAEFHEIRNPDPHMELNATVQEPHLYINLGKAKAVSPTKQIVKNPTGDDNKTKKPKNWLHAEKNRLIQMGVSEDLVDNLDETLSKEELTEQIKSNIETNIGDHIITYGYPDYIAEFDEDEESETFNQLVNYIPIKEYLLQNDYKDVDQDSEDAGELYTIDRGHITLLNQEYGIILHAFSIDQQKINVHTGSEVPKKLNKTTTDSIKTELYQITEETVKVYPIIQTIKEYFEANNQLQELDIEEITRFLSEQQSEEGNKLLTLQLQVLGGGINQEDLSSGVFSFMKWIANNSICQ